MAYAMQVQFRIERSIKNFQKRKATIKRHKSSVQERMNSNEERLKRVESEMSLASKEGETSDVRAFFSVLSLHWICLFCKNA